MLEASLVIFDCDGVLVDTEPLTNRVLAECVSEAGWAVDAAYSVEHFKGRNLADILVDVETRVGRALPGLLDEYRRRMYLEIETVGVPAVEGIHGLLDALDGLDGGPERCVATNAPLKKAGMTLGGSGLVERFVHREDPGRKTLFSAYEVGKWKPDPGLFLHAAEEMGHDAGGCIVVEDSVAGVVAARRAGMRVIGLATLTPGEKLAEAGATRVVGSHDELTGELVCKP